MRARLLAITLALVAVAASAACSPASPPDENPSVRGTITSISRSGDSGSMLVESAGPPVFDVDRAQMRVDGDTSLLREAEDGYEPIAFSEFAEGDAVDIWFEGPVAESYPVQAYARAIVLR